jgi:hypothetical protein
MTEMISIRGWTMRSVRARHAAALMVALVALPFRCEAQRSTWDAADCADATDRLKRAADDAADAGDTLLSSPSASALSSVRSELDDVESALGRALSSCGSSRAAPRRPASTKAEQEKALAQITAYTARMQATDPNYKRTEAKVVPAIKTVIETYPPQYWLSIIRLLYLTVSPL